MTDFASVQAELDKFDRFITKYNEVINRYTSQFPELKTKIAQLRLTSSKSKVPSCISPYDDVLEHSSDLHLLKSAWRRVAKLSHPDKGGDPIIFHYASLLYKSKDVKSLNHLLECLERNDFSDYMSAINQKLTALYSLYRNKPGYQIMVADMAGNTNKARDLTQKTLEFTVRYLEHQNKVV